MGFLYTFLIFIYGQLIRIAAPFNRKAGQWVAGRNGLFRRVEDALQGIDREATPLVWFHASSLGEFEQGRPVLEAYRDSFAGHRILLTFFSPSGFEIRKNYDKADYIFYLPLDTASNARRWVKTVRPAMVFFVKYDFWFNIMDSLAEERIPVYYISVLFRPGQYFFRWYGWWARKKLEKVTWFFAQDRQSEELLKASGITNVTVAGDTRFDRVYAIANEMQSLPLVERFCAGKQVLIAGSTWKEDEDIVVPIVNENLTGIRIILVPHDVSAGRIREITSGLRRPFLLYSQFNGENAGGAGVLVVDTIGILSRLYRYATLAYIGGGFGTSIHNIQEPITFGVPVLFGPKYRKFREANDLVNSGGAFCVHNRAELAAKVSGLLAGPEELKKASAICKKYVDANRGATGIILDFLKNRKGN